MMHHSTVALPANPDMSQYEKQLSVSGLECMQVTVLKFWTLELSLLQICSAFCPAILIFIYNLLDLTEGPAFKSYWFDCIS
jgi:hypothetical protein